MAREREFKQAAKETKRSTLFNRYVEERAVTDMRLPVECAPDPLVEEFALAHKEFLERHNPSVLSQQSDPKSLFGGEPSD
jgi:hypothetical protein